MIVALILLAGAQGGLPPAAQGGVPDSKRIDLAVEKGCAWFVSPANRQAPTSDPVEEIELLSLRQAGRLRADGRKRLVEVLLKKNLLSTFQAAIQAMALSALDPKLYRSRIAECAQMLVDNQCENGQWWQGEKMETASFESDKVLVRQRRINRAPGDNINAFFAALGLRAAVEADVAVEDSVFARAKSFWILNQGRDGGWGYGDAGQTAVSNLIPTAGAISALSIELFYSGQEHRSHPAIQNGLKWLGQTYDHTADPRYGPFGRAYYLLALTSAGTLTGANAFGKHRWSADIASRLMLCQRPDGAWDFGGAGILPLDTGFAVLCLKPPPLVLSRRSR